jgi:hypothetical protein
MPQFEYCPPFAVFQGGIASVKPVMETHSLQTALENLRTRPNSRLMVSVLVTERGRSTLVPVTLNFEEIESMPNDDARKLIQLHAENRFRSLPSEVVAVAAP